DDDDDDKPWSEPFKDDAEITTYAAALKKTDGSTSGTGLAGAKFKFAGLKATKDEDGVYTVVTTTCEEGEETELEVDANGMLYIIGLASDASLTGEETQAPNGYNKLTGTVTVTPQDMEHAIYTTSGTIYYDAQGNVSSTEVKEEYNKTVTKNLSDLDAGAVTVVNEKGTELPSTGGIGTTIFYVIGTILVLGAGVVLITRRRMDA
ncbi:MAG: LPXTG cell wall anchor domain-containing protein, partial [Oscillospiraceae bacterium]|nr:LPXTG cell wall anchor domain-containing protein [Oscillospiraceae bacterium]